MRRIGNIIFVLGCLLIAGSLGLLLFLQVQAKQAQGSNREIVQAMENILTDRREGSSLGEEIGMPVLELQGEDFVALLEIPSYGLKLPVSSSWDQGKVRSHPCRFSGTAYNGSLVIGGSDQPGQLDFLDRISDGTAVTVTDMTGRVFSYVVERVERSSAASAQRLADGQWDLTLFVRDAQLLEYIILRCEER